MHIKRGKSVWSVFAPIHPDICKLMHRMNMRYWIKILQQHMHVADNDIWCTAHHSSCKPSSAAESIIAMLFFTALLHISSGACRQYYTQLPDSSQVSDCTTTSPRQCMTCCTGSGCLWHNASNKKLHWCPSSASVARVQLIFGTSATQWLRRSNAR